MSDPTAAEALALLDELLKLAAGSRAGTIEVESGDLAVVIVRDVRLAAAELLEPVAAGRAVATAEPERVLATSVGIFSATREWASGDPVTAGASLGAIQSLGHMTEITAPIGGTLTSVLIAGGAPVEYGQPLFTITAAS